jgi:hypothetical protein
MRYIDECHCGNVQYEVEMEIEPVLSCNCSIFSKKGSLLAFAPAGHFKLLKGEDSLSDYQFYKKIIRHFFYNNCGIGSFGRGTGPDGMEMVAINVRFLDNVDIDKFPLKKIQRERSIKRTAKTQRQKQ